MTDGRHSTMVAAAGEGATCVCAIIDEFWAVAVLINGGVLVRWGDHWLLAAAMAVVCRCGFVLCMRSIIIDNRLISMHADIERSNGG